MQSELKNKPAPFVKVKVSTPMIMWMVVLALLPISINAVRVFGISSFWIILSAIISAVLTEIIICKMRKKVISVDDGSAVITGLLLGLSLPPTVPLYLPIVGSIVAIALIKMIFGGLGNNIFNPALAGRAFLVAAWPSLMAAYLGLDALSGASPLGYSTNNGYAIAAEGSAGSLLNLIGSKTALYSNYLFSNPSGCIGEASAVLIIAGLLFLALLRIVDLRVPLTFIGTVGILAYVFGIDPIFYILSGGLLFVASFMATDYVTSPNTLKGRIIFALGCGILTFLIRIYSSYADGVTFAVLLMNAAVPLIDRFMVPKPFGYVAKKK